MNTDIVITFDGTEAKRKDCRFIKGEFYIKQKQCFVIDGVWYRINSNMITLDYETKEYVLIKSNPALINGIVGYDVITNEFILGYFSPNLLENVDVWLASKATSMVAINYKILPKHIFIENLNGSGFRQSTVTNKEFDRISTTFGNHKYKFTLPYGLRHFPENLLNKIKTNSEEYAAHAVELEKRSGIMSVLMRNSKTIIPYSFGLEFETSCGKIPTHRLLESGLVPLRDGSISGMEYVTIPLQGKLGLRILEESCINLHKFTNYTVNESLHLHLGGMPTTKEYIGTLYTILAILEKEFYSMFPEWYIQTSKFKARGKDYNQPLRSELVDNDPSITFSNIAFYLSAGKKFTGFGRMHPNDPDGEHKWQVNERYSWCNFIPALFGDNKTVEFRIHTPTDDITKVINWILICSSVLKYTDDFVKAKRELKDNRYLDLKTIINDVYDVRIATYINNYISERKAFRKEMSAMSDFTGVGELAKSYKELV
jgi:hypothetical protein